MWVSFIQTKWNLGLQSDYFYLFAFLKHRNIYIIKEYSKSSTYFKNENNQRVIQDESRTSKSEMHEAYVTSLLSTAFSTVGQGCVTSRHAQTLGSQLPLPPRGVRRLSKGLHCRSLPLRRGILCQQIFGSFGSLRSRSV